METTAVTDVFLLGLLVEMVIDMFAQLRVDLERMQVVLLAVVSETMHPAELSLWMRDRPAEVRER